MAYDAKPQLGWTCLATLPSHSQPYSFAQHLPFPTSWFLTSKALPTMFLFLYAIDFLAFARLISANCYNINGNIVTSSDVVPCNNIAGMISMCCATNRGTSSPYTPDTCLPNGLCQNLFTNQTTGKPDTNYWREGCSDSGWNNQFCLEGICSSSSVSTVSQFSQMLRTRTRVNERMIFKIYFSLCLTESCMHASWRCWIAGCRQQRKCGDDSLWRHCNVCEMVLWNTQYRLLRDRPGNPSGCCTWCYHDEFKYN